MPEKYFENVPMWWVTWLSATVLHVSVKFTMLSPKYEHWNLKGHELQKENDKMNMKCQHMRRDVMMSFPKEKLSQTFPFPNPFFKPGRVTSQQLTSWGLPLRQNSTCAVLCNKVVNFHSENDKYRNWINFGKFWKKSEQQWGVHIEKVREQKLLQGLRTRRFYFIFRIHAVYLLLSLSLHGHVPVCAQYLTVKWFDGDLYLPTTFCICRVDIQKIQSNMFSLPFVVILFPVVWGKEKKPYR